jgi:hypothetical protein
MRSLTRFVLVTMLIAVPGVASAQGWGRGWFEQWSGPGSFLGHDLTITAVCELDDEFVFLGRPDDDERNVRWCLDLGFGFYNNLEQDRPRNGDISFRKYQALVMVNPFASGVLEFGAGAGLTDFDGDAPDFSFVRFHLPARVAFKPFRVGRSSRDLDWRGIPQVVANVHVFPRPITNVDTRFTEHEFQHHYQGNVMLFFDFSSLLFRR